MITKHSKFKCQSCKSEFEFKDIRYGIDGKTLYCTKCFNDVMNKEKQKNVKTTIYLGSNNESDLIKLICVDCRYKFSYRKGSRIKLMCPYCGKNRLMRDEATAEKLVEEASKMTYSNSQTDAPRFNKLF